MLSTHFQNAGANPSHYQAMMPESSASSATAAACALLSQQQVSGIQLSANTASPTATTASTANTSVPESPTETCSESQLQQVGGQSTTSTTTRATGLDLRSPLSSSHNQQATPVASVDLRRQLCDQNVFVFHLPSEWTEEDLRREFGRYGSILSCKVVKRPDGSSKGYGFVCFNDSTAAFASVEGMNGRAYGGKRLKVSLKKTPEECLHLQVQKLMEISNANQPYDRDRDCTLFVFHLPSSWDDKDMYQHFQSFGTLLSAKIAKKDDSASRGYGFVTYDNPRAAALAIANMNGVEVGHNKRLKVQLKQQSNPPQPVPGCTIFIFHLPNDWTDNHLRQHFSHFGKILGATVQRDSLGNSRGYGFVSFDRQRSALNAVIGMNGFSVGHKRLKVSLKRGDSKYAQSSTRDLVQSQPPFFHTSDISYWDAAAAAAAADFAATQNPLLHNPLQQNSLPSRPSSIQTSVMQQAFSSTRPSTTYTPNMNAAVSDAASRIIPQMANYPSAAANFGYPSGPLASAAASGYSSYLPHWNAPSELGLGSGFELHSRNEQIID